MTQQKARIVPALRSGGQWFVELKTGSRKKGTLRTIAVSDPVYTLAQAQAFCANNNATDIASEYNFFN
jgi:hypothetical protein